MKVKTRYRDGCYSLHKWEGRGPFVEIPNEMWTLYAAHVQQERVWHAILQRIDNRIFEMEQADENRHAS